MENPNWPILYLRFPWILRSSQISSSTEARKCLQCAATYRKSNSRARAHVLVATVTIVTMDFLNRWILYFSTNYSTMGYAEACSIWYSFDFPQSVRRVGPPDFDH